MSWFFYSFSYIYLKDKLFMLYRKFMITTFEKCLKIYNENPEFFIYKKGIVHWETLHLFSYGSTEHNLFFETSDVTTALQMRWIIFKWETNPKLFSLGFQKFFNYWEFEESIDWIKNKKVKQITEKVDGSLILCWLFDDWELFLHTKGVFENEYSNLAHSVITDKQKEMAISLLKDWWFPMFELIWPKLTQLWSLTINYEKDELVFLWARNVDWKYLSYEEIKELSNKYETRIPNIYKDLNLEDIIKLSKTDKEHEWVVFMFKDDSMLKIKFDFYIEQNFFKNKSDKNMLKVVLNALIENNYDDLVASFISLDDEEINLTTNKKNKIKEIILKASKDIEEKKNFILNDLEPIIKSDFHLSVKDLALKYKGYKYFSLLMNLKRNNELDFKDIYKFLLRDDEFLSSFNKEIAENNS